LRLWTLHPRYLDAAGLVALWREALLAKAVLQGRTAGYRHHPQLDRFKATANPPAAINAYLHTVYAESVSRGYRFDVRKLDGPRSRLRLSATSGQLAFEWRYLLEKLRRRAPSRFRELKRTRVFRAHPQFRVRPGPVARWEKGRASVRQ